LTRTFILYEGRKTDFQKFLAAFICALLLTGSVFVADTTARVPAFPGAEGCGRFATGGRGSDVYEVNNLNNSGPGSIVDAVSQGNRTIVFRVSGTIPLGDVILEPKSNTTIAGQTAPGDGICIKGRIHIKNYVHDIIIRYIRVRVDAGAANSSGDAIDIDIGSNIIIDHVTASYSRDEGISCQEDSNNVTVQWCLISEALTYEAHSYGSLIRGQYGQEKTYHHNLYAHNNGRNPRPGNYVYYTMDPEGLHFDFRNNVVYNWKGSTAGNNDDGAGYVSRYNFIGNVYIPGSESTSTSSRRAFRERSKLAYGYFADNSYDGIVSSDPWSIVNFDSGYMTSSDISNYKARSYLVPMEPVTTTSPAQAKTDVLADAGASFPKRDIIDTRIVNDVLNKTGHSIVNTSSQPEGGWPTLNSTTAPTDTDHDGMPDTWESSHGLNPNDDADRNDYNLSTDYTNLEVYLTDLIPGMVDWIQRHNGTANSTDYAKDIALDSAGNVIVTGYAKNTGTNYDFVTRKYTPYGSIIWTKTYNRSSSNLDFAMALAVDANSNIIVAGYGYNTATGYDGIIVKYDSGGSQLWAAAYNYSGASNDRFYDVATDANGNIYAVGKKNNDALIAKYTPAGSVAWTRIYNGAAGGLDVLYKIAVDSNGSVYACGESAGIGTDQDCLTLKYSPAGDRLWDKTYNGSANGWDLLEAIAIDSAGNVYVTGSVETATDSNYVTIKYSPDGNSLWPAPAFYSSTATGWDEAYAITVTSDGNVAVTGYSEGTTSADAATVKYNSQTGAQLWAARYNDAANSVDYAEAIAADNWGNVYVLGRSTEANSMDYLTICYGLNGTQLWKMNYNGPELQTDTGTAIAVDSDAGVYVTGYSIGSDSNYDYATIKYAPNPCPNRPAGDLSGDCKVDFFDFTSLADSYIGSTENRLKLKDIADTWLECGLINQNNCWQ
jgi:pectate lyase